ncbi:methionine sulfoxide reductase A [Photobacterium aquae]|uniref:Peptide methionine sulfoxide reductase MsrA n=1 Tax=Photobacterium aquae TaxID=1195763 RepID=A0A0J1GSN2_9GAMM|nr:peptide-methionine (S)-S-oxide reductase MsrA [Photobacterium aquae]KLV02464.1 methionine sulfoxide reductase A [Photobacterium aquae]
MSVSKLTMPTAETALPGRDNPILPSCHHAVNGTDLLAPPPASMETLIVGMGCFWGAERLFWKQAGVYSTSVGYSAGFTPNPTYQEVCSGQTGHAEVVRVIYDPTIISLDRLLRLFWENHNPTQGFKQGNDVGSQYRSIILTHSLEQYQIAQSSMERYQHALGHTSITTQIQPAQEYYLAEEYHQQYLAKNPNGYCGLGGIGICFPPN